MNRETYVRGLKAELVNYERKGDRERAAEVRSELSKYGVETDDDKKTARPVERAVPADDSERAVSDVSPTPRRRGAQRR